MPHENHDIIERKKAADWHAQKPLMDNYYKGAAIHMNSIPNLDAAFMDQKEIICCMDEGTAHIEMGGKLSMAGSGILYPANSWEERLDKVAALCVANGVMKVTSHEGCGAAALAAKRDGIDVDNPDEYGEKWAAELQERINLKTNGGEGYSHLSSAEMVRPAEFHNARVVWFDVTGRFNPDKLGVNIPPGFLINYATKQSAQTNEEANYPFSELSVAIAIAFGDHGFGNLFDITNKFVITIVAADQLQFSKSKLELESFITTKLSTRLRELNPKITDEEIKRIGDSLKIDHFIALKTEVIPSR